MIECPACGYNPNPIEVKLSDSELKHQQILNTFSKNLQNTWWLSQPEYVCNWAKTYISPKSILDIGCGDGRWLPAIIKSWPDVKYTGIDRLQDHIEINQENFTEYEWVYKDLNSYDEYHDTCFLMGTFNQLANPKEDHATIINWIKKNVPQYIVCLFDYNTQGINPTTELLPGYLEVHALIIPLSEKGPNQSLIVSIYEKRTDSI